MRLVESFGQRLKKLRLRAAFSQKQVAERAGVSASTYRDWEYGKKIKGEPYADLASALNVSITELYRRIYRLEGLAKSFLIKKKRYEKDFKSILKK